MILLAVTASSPTSDGLKMNQTITNKLQIKKSQSHMAFWMPAETISFVSRRNVDKCYNNTNSNSDMTTSFQPVLWAPHLHFCHPLWDCIWCNEPPDLLELDDLVIELQRFIRPTLQLHDVRHLRMDDGQLRLDVLFSYILQKEPTKVLLTTRWMPSTNVCDFSNAYQVQHVGKLYFNINSQKY